MENVWSKYVLCSIWYIFTVKKKYLKFKFYWVSCNFIWQCVKTDIFSLSSLSLLRTHTATSSQSSVQENILCVCGGGGLPSAGHSWQPCFPTGNSLVESCPWWAVLSSPPFSRSYFPPWPQTCQPLPSQSVPGHVPGSECWSWKDSRKRQRTLKISWPKESRSQGDTARLGAELALERTSSQDFFYPGRSAYYTGRSNFCLLLTSTVC